ncbi:hypothetical protein [Methylocella silvestris]|nr:hypothetical protein [Methylocella silvestris]
MMRLNDPPALRGPFDRLGRAPAAIEEEEEKLTGNQMSGLQSFA